MTTLFGSFFLAGFECATGYNVHGQWVDQIAATQHDRFADNDYARLSRIGIRAVREGVRWPIVDLGGRYVLRGRPFRRGARRHGIEVVGDLFHFGYPDDADRSRPTSRALRGLLHAVARIIAAGDAGVPWFPPVNAPS